MAEFEHIADPRQRLLARLNWAMRPGTIDEWEEPLAHAAAMDSTHHLDDLGRTALAEHLLAAIADEMALPDYPRLSQPQSRNLP